MFGDVRRLLTVEFVRQEWLAYVRQQDTDPAEYEFHWGQRAKQETSKGDMLDLACALYGDTDPSTWKSQYSDVRHERKKQEAQAGARRKDGDDVTVADTQQDTQNEVPPTQRATRSRPSRK